MNISTPSILSLSKKLLTGLHFFAKDDNNLITNINKLVDKITFEIDTQSECFFGFKDISLTGLGGKYIDNSTFKVKPILKKTSLNKKTERRKLIEEFSQKVIKNKDIIELKVRKKPQLRLVFNEPTFVSNLILSAEPFHRLMTAHENLVIKTIHKGITSVAYSPKSDNNYLNTFNKSLKLLSIDIKELEEFSSIFDMFEHALMNKIVAKEIELIDNLFLHHCLPLLEFEPDLNDFQILVLATIIFKINLSRKWRPTQIYRYYRNLLWHDKIIQKVMSKYNKIHEIIYQKEVKFILSKHSMQPSKLLQKKNQYLDAMQLIISEGQEIGIEIIICYGTLLGAIRNQSFLAHDDDVDLLVLYKDVRSSKEAIEQEEILCKHLENKNIRIRKKPKGIGFWATDPKSKIQLDMFACWEPEKGQTMLMMEHLEYRTVESDILSPPSKVKLLGIELPGPSKPKAFLQERYGTEWEIPDPYHEFPWPVKKD